MSANGELSFHGKTTTIEKTLLKVEQNDNEIIIAGNFLANASDLDINIAKIV